MSRSQVSGYAVKAKDGKLEKFSYETEPLGPLDVLVAVSYCGVTPNSRHIQDGSWREACVYPVVLGEEASGVVQEVGSLVKHVKKGQNVGVGMQVASCLQCSHCLAGREQQCEDKSSTKLLMCMGTHGAMADKIQVSAHHVYPLPDGLALEQAAHLMTSGATVFHALSKHAGQGDEAVGIIGFGGLGQLTALFARQRGHKTCVFEVDKEKLAEAEKLHCCAIDGTNAAALAKKHAETIDTLFVTAENLNWSSYLPLMRRNGVVVFLCSSPKSNDVTVALWPDLLLRSLSITGSFLSSRADTARMLEFVARNKLSLPPVDVRPLSEAQAALEDVCSGKIKRRIVLKCDPKAGQGAMSSVAQAIKAVAPSA